LPCPRRRADQPRPATAMGAARSDDAASTIAWLRQPAMRPGSASGASGRSSSPGRRPRGDVRADRPGSGRRPRRQGSPGRPPIDGDRPGSDQPQCAASHHSVVALPGPNRAWIRTNCDIGRTRLDPVRLLERRHRSRNDKRRGVRLRTASSKPRASSASSVGRAMGSIRFEPAIGRPRRRRTGAADRPAARGMRCRGADSRRPPTSNSTSPATTNPSADGCRAIPAGVSRAAHRQLGEDERHRVEQRKPDDGAILSERPKSLGVTCMEDLTP
jgi:hypothetical protein